MAKPVVISCKNCRNLVRSKCIADFGGLSTKLLNKAILGERKGHFPYRPQTILLYTEKETLPTICGSFVRKPKFIKPETSEPAPDFWQLIDGRYVDAQTREQEGNPVARMGKC